MISVNKNSLSVSLATGERELLTKKDNLTSLFNTIATIPQNSTIKFRDSQTKTFYKIRGRHAQTLYWLLRYRDEGITPISVCNTAWRLANYIFYLRGMSKLDISTVREPHSGGYHARYFLNSNIDILEIICNGKTVYLGREGA